MKKILENKIVILFYTLILTFSIMWFYRVDKLEESHENYNEVVIIKVK